MGGIAFIVILIIIFLLLCCIRYLYAKLPMVLKSLIVTIKAKLMWSSVLRYMAQKYLDQSILCMMNLYQYYSLGLSQRIITPMTLAYLALMPCLCSLILYRNRKNLHTKAINQSYGSLYLNYDTDKNSAYHFTMVFLYRRLVFAFLLAFCRVSVVLQVYLSICCSLALLIYLVKWMPMDEKRQNILAIFNECVLLVCSYMLLLYTEYVPSPEMRYYFGDYLLYLLYANFGLNIAVLAYEIMCIVRMHCKRKFYHRKIKLEKEKKIKDEQRRKEEHDKMRVDEYLNRKKAIVTELPLL